MLLCQKGPECCLRARADHHVTLLRRASTMDLVFHLAAQLGRFEQFRAYVEQDAALVHALATPLALAALYGR
eukprot:45286-Eustigmatos_ZCMA.PRE.1